MKDEKKRTLYPKVRVSPEEMAAIKKKFANSGMSSLSTFVRAMIFEGYIVHIDENELKRLTVLANNIANNIIQIAHRANVTNKVYKEDIEEIKELGDKLVRLLLGEKAAREHIRDLRFDLRLRLGGKVKILQAQMDRRTAVGARERLFAGKELRL